MAWLPDDTIYGGSLSPALRAAVGQRPNATHSVTFAFDNTPGNTNLWSWRVNVTDLATPNAGLDGFNKSLHFSPNQLSYSDGTRAIVTEWDLTYPSSTSNNLRDYLLNHGNATLCTTSMILHLPQNVTNDYDPTSINGDCTGLLGQDCVTALTQSLANMQACDGSGTIFSLDACQSTLNIGNENFTTHGRIPTGEGALTTGTHVVITNPPLLPSLISREQVFSPPQQTKAAIRPCPGGPSTATASTPTAPSPHRSRASKAQPISSV